MYLKCVVSVSICRKFSLNRVCPVDGLTLYFLACYLFLLGIDYCFCFIFVCSCTFATCSKYYIGYRPHVDNPIVL